MNRLYYAEGRLSFDDDSVANYVAASKWNLLEYLPLSSDNFSLIAVKTVGLHLSAHIYTLYVK